MARVRATADIVNTWLEHVHESGRPHYESGRRLSADGWLIASGFGAGADLAEYLPAGRHGRTRALFLVTGDVFGSVPFHSDVQTIVRWNVAHYANRFSNVDVLLVPFSALLGAGIDRRTIRPLEIRPDRWTETEHALPESLDLDNLATASRTIENGYSSRSEVFTWRLATGARIVRSRLLETWRHVYLDEHGAEYHYLAGAERTRLTSTVRPDGRPFELESPRHYRDRRTRWTDDVRLRDGRWYWIQRRHWLGDSVFTATVDGRRARRRPVSVRDVIAAASLQVANESALRETGYGHQYGADRGRAPSHVRRLFERPLDELDPAAPIVESVPYRKRRRFISSFDSEETRPLYYLATLPYSSRARTVSDAEMDLAPASIHGAIARGRDVRRQGDMFYVATSITDEDLAAITLTRARLGQWRNHTAPKRGHVGYVAPITASERKRRRRYRRRWFRDHYGYGTAGPRTAPGTRRDVRRRRAELERDLANYRRRLRALALGGAGHDVYRMVGHSHVAGARRLLASAVVDIRRALERTETALAELERRRTASRDEYRTSGATGYVRAHGETGAVFTRGYAVSLWTDAATAVSDVFDRRRRTSRDGFAEYRRRLQRALSVHGTGHTATEVVKATAGRVYVRGTVRHVPDLVGENRAPDHRTIRLGDGRRWYLAVRNTVPRNRDVDTAGRRRG